MPMSIALLYLRRFVLSMILFSLSARYCPILREKERKTAKKEIFMSFALKKTVYQYKIVL